MSSKIISPTTTVLTLAVAILVLIPQSAPATAQTTSEASSDSPLAIAVEQNTAETDQKIQARIENIFTELEPLQGVEVYVGEGVVILSGEVANDAAAQQAERLAARLAGVVTVQDEINRTLAVADNVRPLVQSLKTKALNIAKALPLIGLAILVLAAFSLAAGFIARRKSLWEKLAPNAFLAELLAQAIRIAIVLTGIILSLKLLGASAVIATLLGGAGVIGLAIGFAVRDTVENYISSVMLSLRQPFRARDHVIINDIEGIVVRLTSRATILMTLDGNHMRIPNAAVFKGIILNYSTNPERRFDFDLGVDAQDDTLAGMQVGLDAIGALHFVLTDPEPFALIRTVGDSNIVLTFYAWIDQRHTNFGKARSLSIRAAMRALENSGFTLPEPIYRLRFDPQINAALAGYPGGDEYSKTEQEHSVDDVKIDSPEKDIRISEGVIDVSPDKQLQHKLDAEIQSERRDDLLDKDVPHE
jgi:small-conductance mechanosensitive channel